MRAGGERASGGADGPRANGALAIARPRTSRRARFGWVMFDWANQPFLALSAFVFAPYFASTLVGDTAKGQALWGAMLGFSGLVVAFASPVLGAVADAAQRRKPWVLAFSALLAVAAALLWFATPAGPPILAVLVVFAVATVASEFATVFNNAMLPDLVDERGLGRLSGLGWGMGYMGGLTCLLFVLLALVLPAEPMFGLDPETHEPERLTGPLSALWLLVFLVPFFAWTPDRTGPRPALVPAVREGLGRLVRTARHVRALGNVARFLLARMLYHDGLSALMLFAGLYGSGVFGWETTTLGLFAILLTVFAIPGSLLGGVLDDRLGSKRTVMLAVCGLLVGAAGALSVGPERVFFVVPVEPAPDAAPLTSPAELTFLGFGLLLGLCAGPAQAASRTLMARLAPPSMTAEFFGLYAFSGKATAFLAPLLISLATAATGDQRLGLVVVVVFLAAGLAVLIGVREERASVPPP